MAEKRLTKKRGPLHRLWRIVRPVLTFLRQGIIHAIIATVRAFRATAAWIGFAFGRWWKSASFGHIVRSIPTVIVGAVSLSMIFAVKLTADSTVRNTYTTAAGLALNDRDYEAARIYYERVYAMDGQQDETLFRLALVEQASGNEGRCALLMGKLAPRNRAAYAPAHLWTAEQLLQNNSVSREDMVAALAQLTQVIHLEPRNIRANYLLGQILVNSGNLSRAETHLAVAAEQVPEAALLLARVLVLQGKPQDAGRVARTLRNSLRVRLDHDPNDVASRLLLADATMFLEDFQEAVRLVREGLVLADRADLRGKLAAVFVTWSDFVHREQPDDVATRLKLLEQGILANPSEVNLFFRLVEMLLNEGRETQDAGLTKANLERLLAEGQAPRLIHMLLGTLAGEKGHTEVAVFHLQRAFELDPAMPIAANNLAWYLVLSDPPRAAEALSIVEVLVQKWPNVAFYRDTRGHAYAKLGRWNEAISDLEFAVENMPENASAHRVLAQAYRDLGMESLASQHETLAKTKTTESR